jgi:hypothetical protein
MRKASQSFQRFLGWLLCALVLSAALDNIPDPPVIKPHRDKAASACLINPQQAADCSFNRAAFRPAAPVLRFEGGCDFKTKRPLPAEPLLIQASDSSPPVSVL